MPSRVPRSMFVTSAAIACLVLWPRAGFAQADEASAPPSINKRVSAALELGLPLVADAAMRYPEHRQCFSCHHQTLPLLALVAARRAGVAIDDNVLDAQTRFTHDFFAGQRVPLSEGKHIGGRALTVGYGLWTFRIAEAPADETTTAMVRYLVKTQHDDGHWQVQTVRPPMEESSLSTTMIAVLGLQQYGPPDTGSDSELKHQVDAALAKANAWLSDAPAESTEDKVARLWGCTTSKRPTTNCNKPATPCWRPNAKTAAGRNWMTWTATRTPPARRSPCCCPPAPPPTMKPAAVASAFLLDTQEDDGSWHVITRSDPVQVIFDNGDPHGLDQFISTPATCWALTALAMWSSE